MKWWKTSRITLRLHAKTSSKKCFLNLGLFEWKIKIFLKFFYTNARETTTTTVWKIFVTSNSTMKIITMSSLLFLMYCVFVTLFTGFWPYRCTFLTFFFYIVKINGNIITFIIMLTEVFPFYFYYIQSTIVSCTMIMIVACIRHVTHTHTFNK